MPDESALNLPFTQEVLSDDTIVRTFSADVNSDDLIWHRDREDRQVTVIQSGEWFLQLENELPVLLKSGDIFNIPACSWHRVIKGPGKLVVEIKFT